jgi:hypothetical protein
VVTVVMVETPETVASVVPEGLDTQPHTTPAMAQRVVSVAPQVAEAPVEFLEPEAPVETPAMVATVDLLDQKAMVA